MSSGTPHIKFCGMTSLADAERAVELGAWAIGLIFWDGTPRACDRDEAVAISAALRRRVEIAGVFVNATLDEVAATADAVRLSLVQLHGDEGPAYCAEVARRTGCRVIKAVRVRSAADVRALGAFHTDFHLVDSRGAERRDAEGGTFDWDLVRARRERAPLILSGGLTPDNVAEAIAAVRPWGVDVASGVEASPGAKDPARMRAFAAAVRSAGGAPDAAAA